MSVKSIHYLPTEQLREYENHSRIHPKHKILKLAKIIGKFGFIIPILINENREIIAGHARLLAAIELDLNEIPTILVSHLSKEDIQAFRIADNKITDGSEWDYENLKLEFQALIDIDFDMELTAFEVPEIDLIILGTDETSENLDENNIPEPPAHPVVLSGDLFQLGSHRIACCDCRDSSQMGVLMDEQLASIVITDPPYNVKINGHVVVKDGAHQEFAMASGEMSYQEYVEFLSTSFSVFSNFSLDVSLHYHFIDHKHLGEMIEAGNLVYDERINICVWMKNNAGMGSLYRSQHELCCIFKKGKQSHLNNIQLGKYGRSRSNVWCYPGMNSFGSNRNELLSAHPTVKNTQMIEDVILDVTKRNDIVLDGFLGSGTTILAAEKTGRICYGSEIEPRYVEICIERFRSFSNAPVIHVQSGQSFDELKLTRRLNNDLEVANG